MKSLPLSSLHSGSTNGFTPYNLPILGTNEAEAHSLALTPAPHSRYFRLRIWRCSPTNMCTYSILRERTRYSTFFWQTILYIKGVPHACLPDGIPPKNCWNGTINFFGGREYLSFGLEGGSSPPLFRSTWAFWCSVVALIWGKLHHCTGYLTAFGLSGHRCSA